MKALNKCDHSVLQRDLECLLNSKYGKWTITVDERLDSLGFTIPRTGKLLHVPTHICLGVLRGETDDHVCLTVGTSFGFTSIGNSTELGYPYKRLREFPYPALIGVRDAYLAEIHCNNAFNWDHENQVHEVPNKYYRISVYVVDGIDKTRTRVARFEKGREVDESNLKPAEDLDEVLHYSNFDGPSAYRDALSAEGRGYGITNCAGVQRTMHKYNLSFPDAMNKQRRLESCEKIKRGEDYPSFVQYELAPWERSVLDILNERRWPRG